MNPYGNDMIVDQVIGSAYQVVRYVAANMETLIELSDSMDTVQSVLEGLQSVIDNMPALLEISGNLDILSSNVALLRGNREALRRSYAEAGFNLVDGSFEAGGTLVNANDVLLQERTGKGFTGPAGAVAARTDPTSGGFVDVSRAKGTYYAQDMAAAILGAGGSPRVVVMSRYNAPFRPADSVEFSATPELARFTDITGGLWVIANRHRVEHDWLISEGETDHVKALQTCFDLKARHIHMTPGRVYTWEQPTYTDQHVDKKWTTASSSFKIYGNGAEVVTSDIGDFNITLVTTRFSPTPVRHFEVEDLIVRGANRQPGTVKALRSCFDAYLVDNTKITDCTWYGGDFSTLVGVDNKDRNARMDIIRANIYNVLTIQIVPADTSFFFGHCRNGAIKDCVVYQDGVDLAQFCEVHSAAWEVSGNHVFGVRTFAFVDNGGYAAQYGQETARIVFSKNIVSCMNSLVTPTDFAQPFRPGGIVSNIHIVDNQVLFIPTISGRSELPQGIFAPSDQNGNGVESVENVVIHDNLITFADFGAQLTDCSFLTIKSKIARSISFKDNTVRGWNGAVIQVDVLEGLEWEDNKITLRYGTVSGSDCFSLRLSANTMLDVSFSGNSWSIISPTANRQVVLLNFTTASSLYFGNENVSSVELKSYFYMQVSFQKLLDAGVVLDNIPLRYAGINLPATVSGEIGIAELNLFDGGVTLSRPVDVHVGNVSSSAYPANARILSAFRIGGASQLLTAPVHACGGDISPTSITAMMYVSMNTKPS